MGSAMPLTREKDAEGTLLWVTAGACEGRALLEATARQCRLAMRFCRYRELFEQLDAGRCDLVGIEFDTDPGPALALLRDLCKRMPRVIAFAASRDTGVPMIRAAIEAGASDLLSLPLDPQELHKALIKLTQSPARSAGARGAGDVITVCGARGGLGATTIAVNLAHRIATTAGVETALVDLDLQRGDIGAFLNLAPVNSLAAFASPRTQVDAAFLRGALAPHPSGVCVLAAPPEIEEADQVGHDEVELALRLLREQFPYTVVDTARTITGATLAAFEQSGRIFVLTDLSVPGVRCARRLLDLLARLSLPHERAEVLVTRAVPGPVSLEDAVRALGKDPFLVLPRDEAAASAAMNGGMPLNGRPGSLAAAIGELAARVAGSGAAPRTRRGHILRRIVTMGRSARP